MAVLIGLKRKKEKTMNSEFQKIFDKLLEQHPVMGGAIIFCVAFTVFCIVLYFFSDPTVSHGQHMLNAAAFATGPTLLKLLFFRD